MADPCELTLRALAGRLRRGALSASAALEAHLERIERLNPALGAVVSLDVPRARALAAEADAALRRGAVAGPLHGVPVTLKDGIDVAGLRTTIGTPLLDRIADRDAVVAARLRAAGAIVVGHTNVPPFLADLQTANELFGRTANPWDLARTAGGSSGGAAAAVAAGLAPLEVGSDLAGSLRLPAHFCGVYGLKTTEHRVPLEGFFRAPEGVPRSVRHLAGLGPLARDLGDLALVLRVIAGPSAGEPELPPLPLGPLRRRPLHGLRLAAAPSLPGAPVSRTLRAAVERVAAAAADAGAEVVARLPEVDWEALYALFADLSGAITGIFAPGAELRDEQRTLAWYLAALDRRDRIAAAFERVLGDVDALLLPPALDVAFPHAAPYSTIDVDGAAVPYLEHGRLLVPFNVAGGPSLVVPCGRDARGLPVGLQLAGARWSESRLLAVAAALERGGVLPGFSPPPALAAPPGAGSVAGA
jgi:amidase